MEIYVHDFSLPKEHEVVIKETIRAHQFASESGFSKYMVASNTISDLIYAGHEEIAKFCYIKWLYFNKGAEAMISLSDIHLTEKDKDVHYRYRLSIHAMKRSVYIFHVDMMRHIANEISFFYNTHYITKEEAVIIIHDYEKVLDEMEEICVKGFLPFNGKEVDIFYSHILMANDITIVDSDNIQFAIIYAYFLNPIVTKNNATFNIIKGWFHSWIRSANIISMSGANKRHLFFKRQRNDLKDLLDTING